MGLDNTHSNTENPLNDLVMEILRGERFSTDIQDHISGLRLDERENAYLQVMQALRNIFAGYRNIIKNTKDLKLIQQHEFIMRGINHLDPKFNKKFDQDKASRLCEDILKEGIKLMNSKVIKDYLAQTDDLPVRTQPESFNSQIEEEQIITPIAPPDPYIKEKSEIESYQNILDTINIDLAAKSLSLHMEKQKKYSPVKIGVASTAMLVTAGIIALAVPAVGLLAGAVLVGLAVMGGGLGFIMYNNTSTKKIDQLTNEISSLEEQRKTFTSHITVLQSRININTKESEFETPEPAMDPDLHARKGRLSFDSPESLGTSTATSSPPSTVRKNSPKSSNN